MATKSKGKYGSPATGYFNTYAEALAAANRINNKRKEEDLLPPIGPAASDALKYGASGRGEYADQNAKDVEEATKFGVPMSEVGNFQREPNYKIPKATPTLTGDQSRSLAKQYGLQGIADEDYSGLTRAQANAKAQAKQAALKAQQSTLTSYSLNPQTISGFNKKLGDVKLQLDKVKYDPWVNQNQKKDQQKSVLNSYTDQFAGLFGTQDEFNQAMGNSEFQKVFKQYEQMGGNINDIAARVSQTPTVDVTGEVQNPDGTYSVGNQDVNSYLGAMKTASDQRALDSLIPEKEVYQQQIAQQQRIPEQYKEYYFGTPERVGFLEQQKQQKQEEIKLLERRAKLDEKNMRAQADFITEKNQKEMEIQETEVEQNRLAAKNYMTGMLAKLGALNTTGAAPQAIAILEQKYQSQAQKLKTAYQFANRDVELKLNEAVDNIHLERDQKILDTKADLSKSEEEVWKEVFKLQNTADEKSLSVIEKYASEFRVQRDKYTAEAKRDAEKNAKEYQRLAAKYSASKISNILNGGEGDYVIRGKEKGIMLPDGTIKPFNLTPALAQEVKSARIAGEDAIIFFTSTEPAFRDYLITSDLTGLTKAELQAEYSKWKAAKEKKTSKGREV